MSWKNDNIRTHCPYSIRTIDFFLSFASPVFYSPYLLIYINCYTLGSVLIILPCSCLQIVVLITKGLKNSTAFWRKLRTLHSVYNSNPCSFSLATHFSTCHPTASPQPWSPHCTWVLLPLISAYCVLSFIPRGNSKFSPRSSRSGSVIQTKFVNLAIIFTIH